MPELHALRKFDNGLTVGSQPRHFSAYQPAKRTIMIHNPSYKKKPELFHAVALQQQRLGSLSLGAPLPRRRPVGSRPPAQQQQQRSSSRGSSSSAAAAASSSRAASSSAVQCSECDSDPDDADVVQPPLTLAQRMGLESVPDPALTAQEWEVVAERSRQGERSKEPCAICLGGFTTESQVLLSCAHVFHRACLRSWERHAKSRCCPICRKVHYQKRTIHDGANLFRDECAARVQAAWRGMTTRRVTGPQLRRANPAAMRAWSEHRLGSLTDKLVSELDAEHDALDALFAEIDSSVAASRVVMELGTVDWAHCEGAARARGLAECPVCLSGLCAGERLSLLSCTHVYHERCLSSFERFSLGGACLCPVCRAPYAKTSIQK